MRSKKTNVMQRLVGGIDLMIDFATLGEYGLEPVAVLDAGCEGHGQTTGWEALAPARRGQCDRTATGTALVVS
jgi:hypothetical protein